MSIPFTMEIQEAKHSAEILPLEIWGEILGYLANEDLLTSRLVCTDWLSLVDDIHQPKIWKPHFPQSYVANALSLFMVKCIGTRFSNAEEVEQFMTTVGDSSSNQDVFANGTLILHFRSVQQYTDLFRVFPSLVARFGDAIRHFVYFVHEGVPASVDNITTIFQMRNLRSLIIYCSNWSRIGSMQETLKNSKAAAHPQNKFKSVTVLGKENNEFLRFLFSMHGSQVKRMNCCGSRYLHKDALCASGIFAFPNLEDLKISDFTSDGNSALGSGVWPLKRLSVKIRTGEEDFLLANLLESLKRFAGTLESLYFEIEKHQLRDINLVLPENLILPKVTDFRMSFYAGMEYANEFGRVFMNMKHFQLVDNEDMVPKLMASNKNDIKQIDPIEEVMKPLWDKLPEGLEMISVRYRNYSDNGKKQRSTIHKYFQKRCDLNEI